MLLSSRACFVLLFVTCSVIVPASAKVKSREGSAVSQNKNLQKMMNQKNLVLDENIRYFNLSINLWSEQNIENIILKVAADQKGAHEFIMAAGNVTMPGFKCVINSLKDSDGIVPMKALSWVTDNETISDAEYEKEMNKTIQNVIKSCQQYEAVLTPLLNNMDEFRNAVLQDFVAYGKGLLKSIPKVYTNVFTELKKMGGSLLKNLTDKNNIVKAVDWKAIALMLPQLAPLLASVAEASTKDREAVVKELSFLDIFLLPDANNSISKDVDAFLTEISKGITEQKGMEMMMMLKGMQIMYRIATIIPKLIEWAQEKFSTLKIPASVTKNTKLTLAAQKLANVIALSIEAYLIAERDAAIEAFNSEPDINEDGVDFGALFGNLLTAANADSDAGGIDLGAIFADAQTDTNAEAAAAGSGGVDLNAIFAKARGNKDDGGAVFGSVS